ncbi:MAG: NfeD family protein [Proteobacteria bacterium]|nr:NfeD family protein [Pseudomonadota bacterium]
MEQMLSQLVFWHWFALAVILGILDVAVGANFFFVWCGVSAVLVGILKFILPHMNWEYQLLLFSIGVMASLVFWHHLQKHKRLSDEPALNRRAEQYLGRIFTLEVAITHGRGKVRVADSLWLVTGPDMPEGTPVRVIGVDGTILKVEKA